jgi:hypothetical protein
MTSWEVWGLNLPSPGHRKSTSAKKGVGLIPKRVLLRITNTCFVTHPSTVLSQISYWASANLALVKSHSNKQTGGEQLRFQGALYHSGRNQFRNRTVSSLKQHIVQLRHCKLPQPISFFLFTHVLDQSFTARVSAHQEPNTTYLNIPERLEMFRLLNINNIPRLHITLTLHNAHNSHRPTHRLPFLILQFTPIQQSLRPLIQPLLRVS